MLGIRLLEEAYLARFPDYDRGVSVPALVDVPTGQVVTNDFPRIIHRDINPTGIVSKGPAESGWSTRHGRETLGNGRPRGLTWRPRNP